MRTTTHAFLVCVAALIASCAAPGRESSAGSLRGRASPDGPPTVVALYQAQEVQTQNDGKVRVMVGPGSGVLLCPDVVLTTMSVGRSLPGPMMVSNLAAIATPLPVVVRHKHWFDDHYTLQIAAPEDARTIPEGAIEIPVFRHDDEIEGFLALPLDRPYGQNLPYPTLATSSSWTKGQFVDTYGYGITGASSDREHYDSDGGVRRNGTARFVKYARRNGVPGSIFAPLLAFQGDFTDGAVVHFGDSGGPSFGPLTSDVADAPLVGIHAETNLVSHFFDLDVAMNAVALQDVKARLCGRSAGQRGAAAPAEGPVQQQVTDVTEPVGAQGLALEEGDTVCACHQDCDVDCPPAE